MPVSDEHPMIQMMYARLRTIADTNQRILEETEKQTALADKIAEVLCSEAAAKIASVKKKSQRQLPLVLTVKQVAQILHINTDYARNKVSALKKKVGKKYWGSILITDFCEATAIPYHDVMQSLGYDV